MPGARLSPSLWDVALRRRRFLSRISRVISDNLHKEPDDRYNKRLSGVVKQWQGDLELCMAELQAPRLESTVISASKRFLRPSRSNGDWLGIDLKRSPSVSTDPAALAVRDILRALGDRAREARAMEYIYRCEETMLECCKWFVLLDTITLGSEIEDPEIAAELLFAGKSAEWKKYKARFRDAVLQAEYGTRSSRVRIAAGPEAQYCRHFSVVERGARTGRLHVHTMWWLRSVPKSWRRDPNNGRDVPDYREISSARSVWRWGYNMPVAFRTGFDDAWSRRAGFTWPIDKKTGKPLQQSGLRRGARYMAKYLTKDQQIPWRTRIRMTRSLGLRRLSQHLHRVPLHLLRPLSRMYSCPPRKNLNPPRNLISRLSKRSRYSRIWDSKRTLLQKRTLTHSPWSLSATLFSLARSVTGKMRLSLSDCFSILPSVPCGDGLDAHGYVARCTVAIRALDSFCGMRYSETVGLTGAVVPRAQI